MITVRTWLLMALVALTASCATVGEKNDPFTAEIIRYGIYWEGPGATVRDAPDTATGYTTEADALYIGEAHSFEIRKGFGIGFDYQLRNVPPDSLQALTMVAEHPVISNPGGEKSTVSRQNLAVLQNGATYADGVYYFFTEQYEMVPGQWTLKLMLGDKTLLVRSFTVTATAEEGGPI